MEEKITPEKINRFLLLVKAEISNIEKDINTLNTFGKIKRNNMESMSANILTKEVQKLKDDLEIFRNMDIKNIKDVIFQEKFTLLLEELDNYKSIHLGAFLFVDFRYNLGD
ncbi:hypothetical protein LGL55_10525 [Clostridium tagluense]|uniref:hypothetical protein n=1 Tax=Clostridium tagluense TaxID=360422 RepID=UPI001CF536F5|nr:hypothetical protein [Clostridium tagluense]MCB2311626.1 hypothetical protein [Clostridium tagluense]MCB2316350.1 hypothetical protein [Clostridium tagluense]MCB2321266.1 hypothetical protein [Clostridium tagluense]MCB2326219.1 hypothetical protein [Clostridium tagluense]MCB2331002.1 hypothetical protein [Clostridium tagluense]